MKKVLILIALAVTPILSSATFAMTMKEMAHHSRQDALLRQIDACLKPIKSVSAPTAEEELKELKKKVPARRREAPSHLSVGAFTPGEQQPVRRLFSGR